MALLGRVIGGKGGGKSTGTGGPPAPGFVTALTPEGMLVRVPAAAVMEIPVKSPLQQLASYAVMAPPPGSSGPPPASTSTGNKNSNLAAERGLEVFDEVSKELKLDPETLGRGADEARAAADAEAAGLVGPRGEPGTVDAAVQSHSGAPLVRWEYGVSGRDVQSAHIGPTSFLRDLWNYSRGKADTVLLDREIHANFDSYWKDWAITQRRAGRTQVAVSELYSVMLQAIDRIPGLTQRMKNALAWRLEMELFKDLKLKPTDSVPLPYANVTPGP